MNKMAPEEIRKKFLQFFKEKKHAIIPSASLIPENDPTVLFTTAGMHPLVPFLLGEPHPEGKRLANFQKSVRTGDIESVGDQWHLTFFEMLGNWSLGDYFKKGAIEMSLEFLTSKKWLGLDVNKLSVSCFEGDKDAPKDNESADIWRGLGIPEERIYFFPKSENWWGPAGQTGPCGPDTEMFYDTGKPHCKPAGKKRGENCNPSCGCGKFVEIWNDVFMQYNKKADGSFETLKQQNVDTGMGLERISAVINGVNSNYETDLMKGTMDKVKELCGEKLFNENIASARIITDHLRTATFILGDEKGITPGNVGQGYVLRRLIRRAIRHARNLGISDNFTAALAKTVVERFTKIYPELGKNKERIYSEIDCEETRFKETIEKGMHLLEREIEALAKTKQKVFPPKLAFDLYQSHGFPFELTQEIVSEKGLSVDKKEFDKRLEEHQALSRKGAEHKFKGGLADMQEETTKLHTATHLLNAALRKVLGEHVFQKGSNITAERLRFDFPNPEKVPAEKLKQAEDLINEKIREGFEVKMEIMPVEEAKKSGAMGVFDSRYGEKVKVYTVFNPKTKEVFSKEICGGPHVQNLKGMGHFKIVKEEAVAAGVRRIKAVLE
ncbi:MAG: alanine--tRNA ligase [Candidatus Diapherotrites archaeon]